MTDERANADWRFVANIARATVKTREDMRTALSIIASAADKALGRATPAPSIPTGSDERARGGARVAARGIRSAMERSKASGHKQAHLNFGALGVCLNYIDAALAASRPTDAGADLCHKDGQACYVGKGTDDAHHRCGTVQCGMRKPLATPKPPVDGAMRGVLAEAVRGFEVVQAEAQTDTLRRWAERHAGKLRFAIRNLTGDGAGA